MNKIISYLKKEFKPVFFTNILIDCIIGITFGLIAKFGSSKIEPHHMDIPLGENNPNNLYSYEKDTVSWDNCFIIGYVPIGILIIIFSIIKKSPLFFIQSSVTALLSLTTGLMGVNLGKKFAGRPRPHFWDRYSKQPTSKSLYQSFPSGHSECIFNGMTFTLLFWIGQTKLFSKKGQESWKIAVAVIPFIVAFMVIITRTRDHFHHFSDVIGGSLIGFVSALVVYCTKYCSLFGDHSDDLKIVHTKEYTEEKKVSPFDV